MPRFTTVNEILNDVAVECGLNKDVDPVGSQDETFVQLTSMMNIAGQQLVKLYDWQMLEQDETITTQAGDSGIYTLPPDFDRMIDQTGWDRTNRVAIGGPLSNQDWAYLEGRDFSSSSIYVSFKLEQGKYYVYPQPPPVGLELSFSYISRNWLASSTDLDNATRYDRVQVGSNICLFDALLMTLYLKVRFKNAKGFDVTNDKMELDAIFGALEGQDSGAPILSAGGSQRGFPYLNGWDSVGDTNFGRTG